jgi:hypothetical protein
MRNDARHLRDRNLDLAKRLLRHLVATRRELSEVSLLKKSLLARLSSPGA